MEFFTRKIYWLAAIVMCCLIGFNSFADTSIGALGGVTELNNGGGNPFTYGLNLESRGAFTIGLTYNTLTPNSTVVSTQTYSQGLSNLYAHAELMFGTLGLGVLGGINWWNNTSPGASNTTNFIYGLLAHWDWQLTPFFSIGPRVDGIWSTATGAYAQTDILGVLKIWF